MIRKARLSDLPDLLRLYDQLRSGVTLTLKPPSKPDPHLRSVLKGVMASKQTQLLVYLERGKVIGTCTAYILPRLYRGGKPLGILDSIVVDSQSRSKGIGKKLIDTATRICCKAGCGQVNLTSNTQRVRAHRFYESLGFEPTYIGFRKQC